MLKVTESTMHMHTVGVLVFRNTVGAHVYLCAVHIARTVHYLHDNMGSFGN